ncbi:thioredoxin [Baekduia soli]|uniref:Thioredoxin n=1 Tax=Baekduia soli TaxID=496014 RepID=A0A5B8U7V3_9ACTN|nr:thioredoxin [Baekduia soli]QEC49090.1 thioredoxin [Baekduia soli]
MAVIDVSEQDFQQQVIEASKERPVVVDYWAEWCGPCRALGPILEREAAERDGAVTLAKLDTDANQRLAAEHGIQGIPAVKAFRDGKVVAEFVGAQPPAQVKAFFDSLLPSEADGLVAAGDEDSLRRAIELEPARADAKVALAILLRRRGDVGEALVTLENAEGDFAADGLAARIRLERAEAPGTLEAFALLDGGDPQGAVDGLIEAIGQAPDHKDDLRRVVVAILDAFGVDHPFARDARRRLAGALY